MADAKCSECEAARRERDEALLALAREREKLNALLLAQPQPRAKPMRYWAVDVLNDGVKKALPLPHAGVRAVARLLRGLRKDQP